MGSCTLRIFYTPHSALLVFHLTAELCGMKPQVQLDDSFKTGFWRHSIATNGFCLARDEQKSAFIL